MRNSGSAPPIGTVIGWADVYDRREVRRRNDNRVLGYVRFVENRWFAEDARRLPIEGTFRTRRAAVDALLDATPNWRSG